MAMQLALREAPPPHEAARTHPTPLARTLERQGRRATWVARQLGVHRNTMSRWVNGRDPIPRARVAQIAALLAVPPTEIAPEGEPRDVADHEPGQGAAV